MMSGGTREIKGHVHTSRRSALPCDYNVWTTYEAVELDVAAISDRPRPYDFAAERPSPWRNDDWPPGDRSALFCHLQQVSHRLGGISPKLGREVGRKAASPFVRLANAKVVQRASRLPSLLEKPRHLGHGQAIA